MYFVKTPKIAQAFNKKAIWNIPNKDNAIFITFDDGPTPSITNQTLDIINDIPEESQIIDSTELISDTIDIINDLPEEPQIIESTELESDTIDIID